MSFKTFSVAGEALNFGARRMETIMRIAWLPVALLLVLEMATVFGGLSIINNRIVTYSDFAAGASFVAIAEFAFDGVWAQLLAGNLAMISLILGSLLLQTIIVASFVAPLIRLSGIRETPTPGIIRAPFGADQARFFFAQLLSLPIMAVVVLLPIWSGFIYILSLIDKALKKTYVAFPNVDSLHTIEMISPVDILVTRNQLWLYDYGFWFILAGGGFILLWGLLSAHFRRPGAGPMSFIMRSGAILVLLVSTIGAVGVLGADVDFSDGVATAQVANLILVCTAIGLLMYAALRFFAYPGVAVARSSMALAGTFGVTRRWNLVRVGVVLLILIIIAIVAQWTIERVLFGSVFAVLSSMFSASTVAAQLMNSGDAPGWILPFFSWLWASFQILYKIIWMFFTYGVFAGLLGRLYRESESA